MSFDSPHPDKSCGGIAGDEDEDNDDEEEATDDFEADGECTCGGELHKDTKEKS